MENFEKITKEMEKEVALWLFPKLTAFLSGKKLVPVDKYHDYLMSMDYLKGDPRVEPITIDGVYNFMRDLLKDVPALDFDDGVAVNLDRETGVLDVYVHPRLKPQTFKPDCAIIIDGENIN